MSTFYLDLTLMSSVKKFFGFFFEEENLKCFKKRCSFVVARLKSMELCLTQILEHVHVTRSVLLFSLFSYKKGVYESFLDQFSVF